MTAIVLAGPPVEPQAEGKRSYAPHVLLALGWIALFAYCAVYLTEDWFPQAPSTFVVAEPLIDQVEDLPRQIIGMAPPDVPAAASTPAVADAPTVEIETPSSPPEVHLAAPAAAPHPAPVVAEYVGTWGPTADGCGALARRKGYLPATITPEHAKAGDTVCSFREPHRIGNAWVMTADCGDHDRRWSSKVRLVVDGDHLTWTSAWGSSAYVRCKRRAG